MSLEEKQIALQARLQLLVGQEAGLQEQLRAVAAEKERTFGALRLLEELRKEQPVAEPQSAPDSGKTRKPAE